MHKVPKQELENRMERFRALMTAQDENWEIAYIFTKVSMYYFTGTMQDGVLIIPRDNEATLWVRVSYERAIDESYFANIKPMRSYRDVAEAYPNIPTTAYAEKDFLPLALWERFTKYFTCERVLPIAGAINTLRWKKSAYEMEQMRAAGKIHEHVLQVELPKLLREGMSEADLYSEIYATMVKAGHQGVTRFGMFDTNLILGQLGFGMNSTYPTHFDGPGGNAGDSPAVPFLPSRDRKLRKGDLIFADLAIGVNGYHTDKTMTYMFGEEIPAAAKAEHMKCVEIQQRIAEQLKPGAIPEDIYNNIVNDLTPEFQENFMGFGKRQVKFLGHGIGLFVDELPVLANRFKMPLEENMCIAVEPKKGIAGVGMVGVEDTFVVTPNGGECITGVHEGLILVK